MGDLSLGVSLLMNTIKVSQSAEQASSELLNYLVRQAVTACE
jgi:hypothetical protein